MKDTCYITVNSSGIVGMNKRDKPKLGRGERFFMVALEVADSFFQPEAVPTVSLTVANPQEVQPSEVVVSEVQAEIKGLSETWQAQAKVNSAAARLLEMCLNSGDEETQRQAVAILSGLKADGIRVDVVLPGGEDSPGE